jgi:hypothetical protein
MFNDPFNAGKGGLCPVIDSRKALRRFAYCLLLLAKSSISMSNEALLSLYRVDRTSVLADRRMRLTRRVRERHAARSRCSEAAPHSAGKQPQAVRPG